MLSRKADCHPERENQLTEVYRALRKKVKERGDRWFEPTAGSLEAMRDLKLVAATDAERLKNRTRKTEPVPLRWKRPGICVTRKI